MGSQVTVRSVGGVTGAALSVELLVIGALHTHGLALRSGAVVEQVAVVGMLHEVAVVGGALTGYRGYALIHAAL